jgi:hypothetical protein
MPTLMRKTTPADRNLPALIGGHRLAVTIHRDGALSGWTTVEGDGRALRLLRMERGWRDYSGPVEVASEPEEAPAVEEPEDLSEWAAALVGGTVAALESALDSMAPEDYTVAHAEALVAAESAGKDRSTALSAIADWKDRISVE